MQGWAAKAATLAVTVLVAACARSLGPYHSPTATPEPPPTPPPPRDSHRSRSRCLPDSREAPFDTPRQAMVPSGWSMSVWARVPKARLAAWTPDGALLVSQPSTGQVVKLTPRPTVHPNPLFCWPDWISHTA